MSGRKRALLRMHEKDRKKLAKIETQLGTVDIDFASLRSRIEEIKNITSQQIETKQLERDEVFEKSISHLDSRIHDIEEATQKAIHSQSSLFNDLMNSSEDQLLNYKNHIEVQNERILDFINQAASQQDEQLDWLSSEIENIHQQSQNQQNIAWQNLNYAQEVCRNLYELYAYHEFDRKAYSQIENLISNSWINYQNQSYQAAMVSAQQAVFFVTELRFRIEERNNQFESLRLAALEQMAGILETAMNCQQVKAMDLDGNILDFDIDVNFWTGGLVDQAIQTISSIQSQLADSNIIIDLVSLEELVNQTLPAWENALHEYVSSARIEAIASQTRFEVANTVVKALSEQGFEVETGSYETGDMRLPYHVVLGNLEGNQVHISVSPDDTDPLSYLLDIDSYDSDLRTESELKQRAKELLGSVEAAGIKVGQVYQAEQTITNKLRDSSPVSYTVRSNESRKSHKPDK